MVKLPVGLQKSFQAHLWKGKVSAKTLTFHACRNRAFCLAVTVSCFWTNTSACISQISRAAEHPCSRQKEFPGFWDDTVAIGGKYLRSVISQVPAALGTRGTRYTWNSCKLWQCCVCSVSSTSQRWKGEYLIPENQIADYLGSHVCSEEKPRPSSSCTCS